MLKNSSLFLKPAFRFTINVFLFSKRKMSYHKNHYPRSNRYESQMQHLPNVNFPKDRTYNDWNRRNYRTDNRWGSRYNFFENQKRRDIKISKGLSFLLRHGAIEMKLDMDKYGFVYVNDILKLPGYRQVCVNDIIRIVETNEKQRFHLQRDKYGYFMIGANQGHTIKCENLKLEPITDAESYPSVIHGTTYNAWRYIKRGGLKTMGRTHIHFARGEPGEKGVVSGMRSNSQVLIYIDLEKALKCGIEFFLSRNEVILSKGDESGKIDPFFFESVIDQKTRKSLLKMDF